MKDILNDTFDFNKFLEYDSFLKNEELLDNTSKIFPKKNVWKSYNFLKNDFKFKDNAEFSSLERIRVVVDFLLGDTSVEEICLNERITKELFLSWKSDFLEAFKKYSEDLLVKEKLTSLSKELILKESSVEVLNFCEKHLGHYSAKNLVIPKGEKLSKYSSFNYIENIVVLTKFNNFRLLNKHLEEVNSKLQFGGKLIGCFETFQARAKKKLIYNIPLLKQIYFGFEFILKRVFPKLPYLKKVYFEITNGKNRLLSKAESLGRLISCGFEIIEFKEIDGIHYFVAKKVKEPAYDMSPSYGPLFKMKRVGKNGKIIGVYKFRTMHPYSEYLQDYIVKLNGYSETGKPANDFRLVPYGKLLRRFWIDEIPQLINLIKGDLNLVGARPVSQSYFNAIPKELQELRLKQKPGCIPPYVALNRDGSVESVLQAEKEYLEAKNNKPYTTDIKYFFNAVYNILFKGKRSA